MSRFPEWSYVIYASSWCFALQYIGWDLVKRRARLLAVHASAAECEAEPSPAAAA
jgi:hypothetical protein